jgi:hypothetical protein
LIALANQMHAEGGIPKPPPSVGLVDQRRLLQSLPWRLAGEQPGCQFAQLRVHQRQQLADGARVVVREVREDAGDVAHGSSPA